MPEGPLTRRITSAADKPCTSVLFTVRSTSPVCILPEFAALPVGANVEIMCIPAEVVSKENPTPAKPSGARGMPGKGPRSNSTVFRVRPAIGMLACVAASPAHVKECVDEACAVKSGARVQKERK